MRRVSLLYAILATILFVCFLSFLESKKANASLGLSLPENVWIRDQWVVAEAVELASQKDVTDLYSSEVWQFLSSNGFVQFRDRIIENTGEWSLKNGIVTIRRNGEEDQRSYILEKAGRNEIVLVGDTLKIRLLKLEDI